MEQGSPDLRTTFKATTTSPSATAIMATGLGSILRSLPPFSLSLSGLAKFQGLHDISLGTQERVKRLFESSRMDATPRILKDQSACADKKPEDIPLPNSPRTATDHDFSLEFDVLGEEPQAMFDHVTGQEDSNEPTDGEEETVPSTKEHDIDPSDGDTNTYADTDLPMTDKETATVEEEEDDIEWTPEMVQAVRERTHVTFEGEDESDYTLGPARMIDAADGVVTCTALLVTMELSQAIQASIKGQREFAKVEAAAEDRLDAISSLQSSLRAQISRTEARLEDMSDASGENAAEQPLLEEELTILKKMAEEYRLEISSIQNKMAFQSEQLRDIQAQANALLEEAWTAAKIIEPEPEQQDDGSPAPKQVSLQAEYQAFREKLKTADDFSMLQPAEAQLDTSDDYLRKDVSPEAKAREAELEQLEKQTWDAWYRLENAQAAFDRRDEDRYEEEQARKSILRRGEQPEDASSEVFDLRWHAHERALTRELIEAEEAYDAANAAAIEAGAIHDDTADIDDAEEDDNESDEVFDNVPDGYHLSFEQEIIASCPVARIEKWLAALPDLDDQDEIEAQDVSDPPAPPSEEWDAESLGFGDSRNEIIVHEMSVSRNPMRKKIDAWREVQRQRAAEFAAM